MTQPQSVPFGGNQPSVGQLAVGHTLITVGIGGNGAGLIGVAEECAVLDHYLPFGSACRNHYSASGSERAELCRRVQFVHRPRRL